MDPIADSNKRNIRFATNYASGHSSDDDFDLNDVVIRNPRHSSVLLADEGDGSEADLLGTTPPRSRIRDKERRRANLDSDIFTQKVRLAKRNSDSVLKADTSPTTGDRFRKRASLKLVRSRERDFKQDMSQREHRAESLPSPVGGATPAVPTLVESCSRFMSLTSKLKCRNAAEPSAEEAGVDERRWAPEVELPANRVSFHNTFSMLINMGNIDKGCRRTISREEQVWQNELKDLIWLELQAKIAGRSLAHQDAYLCAQRNIVPTVVQNIIDYRFVNPNPCRLRVKRLCTVEGSREDLTSDHDTRDDSGRESEQDDEEGVGCLSFSCRACSDAVGKAMREVNTLLDSYYNAVALYPSCKAMTVDHPLVATQLFKNRIKAMCLWYNTALHMRLKMLSVRRMMRTMRLKRRRTSHTPSLDSDLSRQSSECSRPCQVRFNMSNNPSDSSNSESSLSDQSKEPEGSKDSGRSSEGADPAKDGQRACEGGDGKEEDVVDCALARYEVPPDGGGQVTPEIVISDSKYGSSDTRASSDSGYTSADEHGDAYALGSLDDLTRLRLLGKCHVSPYREFHAEVLKTQGVRRSMMFIYKLRKVLLHKVHQTLEKPDSDNPEDYQENEAAEVFDDTKDDEDKTDPDEEDDLRNSDERKKFGCWSPECMSMRLPSYRAHFLTLSSICMEAVHDYLSLRLEARPDRPSCLTVKQLITELKEGLDISTEMRRDFVRNVEVALRDRPPPAAAREDLRLLLTTYDATVETVLKQYLSYLTTMSETEIMGRSCLQQEWAFTARLARRVQCAAILAPLTFSDIACNQIKILLAEFRSEFDVYFEKQNYDPLDRYEAYDMCRTVQDIYARWREPLLHTAQWARALAAKLARCCTAFTPQREAILKKLMSMRDFIAHQTDITMERTQIPPEELERTEGLVTRLRLLLLQMFKLGFELNKEMFKLVASPRNEDRGSRRSRPASMQPLRSQERVPGRPRRPETMIVTEIINPVINKEIHRVVHDAARHNMMGARRSVVSSPPKQRHKLMRSESIGEDAVVDEKLFEAINNYGENNAEACIERLLSGSERPPEPRARGRAPAQAAAGPEREWAGRVARAVIQFARCWMRFVVERCDRGRGLRPRWASQGLEFLMLACDPCNTKHLTEEEFEELKQLMDGCISHVVGSRPAPRASDALVHAPHTPRARPRLHSPSPGSPQGSVPAPPTPPNEPDPLLNFNAQDMQGHKKRVLKAIEQLEEQRDEKLRELKMLGRVAERAVTSYEPKLRQLTFKWQRGLKIGAGTFGKVYTVVNTESGQLLAMKELSIGAGDRRALQRAANELRVLEGVAHPHLVRYYGIELHREEMLLFMELCVEGSLEALVATSGALEEATTRRYARQLVSAVHELHARNIVHRDIKSGNIFLTNEGHCLKLGDFGCAVKIRANTTAPGELQGFVGTQAYMAPEVFMKSEGHGRAADIWSLGCVVTEMASGKRPFSEYDSNYQIMFVVGMGGRPEVPCELSAEGRDFCLGCLTHDPDQRPKADQLSLHHFLMLRDDDDDDCKCEAAQFFKT